MLNLLWNDYEQMVESTPGKVDSAALPLSPDDDEVVIQNNKRAKRSTFELDQPPVSVRAKRPSNGLSTKSKFMYCDYLVCSVLNTDRIVHYTEIEGRNELTCFEIDILKQTELNVIQSPEPCDLVPW